MVNCYTSNELLYVYCYTANHDLFTVGHEVYKIIIACKIKSPENKWDTVINYLKYPFVKWPLIRLAWDKSHELWKSRSLKVLIFPHPNFLKQNSYRYPEHVNWMCENHNNRLKLYKRILKLSHNQPSQFNYKNEKNCAQIHQNWEPCANYVQNWEKNRIPSIYWWGSTWKKCDHTQRFRKSLL